MPKSELYVATAGKFRRRHDNFIGGDLNDTFVLGTTKPDLTNTGVPAGTVLTVHQGDYTITTPDTIVENLDIKGRLRVQAPRSGARNCRISGPATSTGAANYFLGDFTNSGVTEPGVLDRCTVSAQAPDIFFEGVRGRVAITRCLIENVVDGIGVVGSGMSWNGCWIRQMTYFTPDSTQGSDNQTHNDCVQFHLGGSTGARARGNRYTMKYTSPFGSHNPSHSAVNASPATGGTQGTAARSVSAACFMFGGSIGGNAVLDFESLDDWFEGGWQPVNAGGPSNLNIGKIWRGKFDGDSLGGPEFDASTRTIEIKTGSTCDTGDGTANQNVFEGTTIAVNVRRNL